MGTSLSSSDLYERIDTARVRILLVDDETDWIDQQAIRLREFNPVIDRAAYPDVATERVETNAYDLVVSDVWFGDGRQRGDEWITTARGSEQAMRAVFTGDESRITNWDALRRAGIPILIKSRDEERFYQLVRALSLMAPQRPQIQRPPGAPDGLVPDPKFRGTYDLFLSWLERESVTEDGRPIHIHLGDRRIPVTDILEDARMDGELGREFYDLFLEDVADLIDVDRGRDLGAQHE